MISVIVPMYNAEMYLSDCLNSILSQTYRKFEVILINDGSQDSSEKICKKYVEIDSRISYFYQENQGVSAARNNGIIKARGEYLVFVDSDDTVEPTYLEQLHTLITQTTSIDLGVCGVKQQGKSIICRGSQKVNGVWEREKIIEGIFTLDSIRGYLFNKIFKKSIIDKYNLLLDVKVDICEDALFCLEYAMHIQCACIKNEPVYNYLVHETSATNQKFNPKYLSVIYAYDQIEAKTKKLQNAKIERKIQIAKIIMNMFVYRKIMRSKEMDYNNELQITWINLKSAYKYLLSKDFPLEEKIKYICVMLNVVNYYKMIVEKDSRKNGFD